MKDQKKASHGKNCGAKGSGHRRLKCGNGKKKIGRSSMGG